MPEEIQTKKINVMFQIDAENEPAFRKEALRKTLEVFHSIRSEIARKIRGLIIPENEFSKEVSAPFNCFYINIELRLPHDETYNTGHLERINRALKESFQASVLAIQHSVQDLISEVTFCTSDFPGPTFYWADKSSG